MSARKLLVVCYYFPPTPSAGSVRVGGLAKFLPRFGWDVTIVTPRASGRPLPDIRVIETEGGDLAASLKRRLGLRVDSALKDQGPLGGGPAAPSTARARLIDLVKAIVAIPDTTRPWIPLAFDATRKLLESERFDALLTSSPPVSAHFVGRKARDRYPLKWIADFRDLWSTDRNSTAPAWRRSLDRFLETRVLKSADALVTVSEPLADELRDLHPGTRVQAILNGFDPDRYDSGATLTADFTITHTGTFYQGRRDPTLFFSAVAHLLADGRLPRDRIRVRLFARHEPWVAALAREHGLSDVVELLPWASWEKALRAQRESQVLLLLHWGDDRSAGVFTAKIFEYLGARRPILAVGGPRGVLSRLLEETGAGAHLTEKAEIERWLLRAWEEFRSQGSVRYRGVSERVEPYSQVQMARSFAELLETLVG